MLLSHYREGWSQRACHQGNVWSWMQLWIQSRFVGGDGMPAELQHVKVSSVCLKTELSHQGNTLHMKCLGSWDRCVIKVCGKERETERVWESCSPQAWLLTRNNVVRQNKLLWNVAPFAEGNECKFSLSLTCYWVALLPRWWERFKESVPGEEPWAVVAALCSLPVYADHRCSYQDVCDNTTCSGWDTYPCTRLVADFYQPLHMATQSV